MTIDKFEYMHGAVLTKLFRKDEPLTLALIETNKSESWSAYKVTSVDTDESIIYMKYSSTPRQALKHISWSFVFTPRHLDELKKYIDKKLFVYLVCAQNDMTSKDAEICFLTKEEILNEIDIDSATNQAFTVRNEKRKKLRVYGTRTNHDFLKVEKDRILSFKF